MIKIWFCKGVGPGSALLRIGLMSDWSHVAIEIDNIVYDATPIHGVSKWSVDEFVKKYQKCNFIAIEISNDLSTKCFLENQLGKKYDWSAIFAFPFRASWNVPDKWFCSELAASALLHGGFMVKLPTHRVTPRDLWYALQIGAR